MSSEFFYKNRKKTLLGLLLLFLRSKTGIFAVLFVALLAASLLVKTSVLMNIPGFRTVLVAMGISEKAQAQLSKESVFSIAMNKSRGQDGFLTAALFKRTQEQLPSSRTSIDLVTGGRDEAAQNPSISVSNKSIKGILTPDEQRRGDGAQGVPIGDTSAGRVTAGEERAAEDNGMQSIEYAFSQNPSPNVSIFGAGGSAGGGRFVNGGGRNGRNGSSGGSSGVIGNSGRLGSFSWKDMMVGKKAVNHSLRGLGKTSIRRLSEAFAAAVVASSRKYAYEMTTSYSGTVYDGSQLVPVQIDFAGVGEGALLNPDQKYVTQVFSTSEEAAKSAERCQNSLDGHMTNASEMGKKFDAQLAKFRKNPDDPDSAMKKPPKCCKAGRWNEDVAKLVESCNAYMAEENNLSTGCGNIASQSHCSDYAQMRVKPCGWLKCYLSVIIGVLLVIAGVLLLVFGVGAILLTMAISLLISGLAELLIGLGIIKV